LKKRGAIGSYLIEKRNWRLKKQGLKVSTAVRKVGLLICGLRNTMSRRKGRERKNIGELPANSHQRENSNHHVPSSN